MELLEAKNRLQPGKARGPYNIVNEFIEVVTKAWLDLTLETFNAYFRTTKYLERMISYLSERTLIYSTKSGLVECKVMVGAPQGSVLGPFLQNVMYDGHLNLELPNGATIIGLADDVAMIIF